MCNHKEQTDYLHPCPFQEEINDNSEPVCNCCDECRYECAMDV